MTILIICSAAFGFFGVTLIACLAVARVLLPPNRKALREMPVTIYLALIFCFLCHSAFATSLIAVRTSSSIYIGADSKVTSIDHSPQGAACKIGIAEDVFWGEAGIILSPVANFNAASIIGDVMAQTSPIPTRIAAFERVAISPLQDILRDLQKGDARYFADHFSHGSTAALETVFAYIDNDATRLFSVDFIAGLDSAGDAIVSISEHNSPSIEFSILGRHEAIEMELIGNKSLWKDYGIPIGIRHLIEIEITAVPDDVGPPIALVEIDKNGAQWISRGVC